MLATAEERRTAEPVGSMLLDYLQLARERSPTIDRVIRQHGDRSVRDYVVDLLEPPPPSVQPDHDFLEVVRRQAGSFLDQDAVDALVTDLGNNRVALTANHHGVDCFAQSAQGSLIYALGRRARDASARTALVLSCGNVPLDNITYPQGLLVYGLDAGSLDQAPRKLPLLSNKRRRWAVSLSPGFDAEMVQRAVKAASRLHQEGLIGDRILQSLQRFLQQDYADPEICDLPFYSDQAGRLNDRMWKRMLADETAVPRLVYLELEKIVIELLLDDLADQGSLNWRLLFDRVTRQRLLQNLEGHRACWQGLSAQGRDSGDENQAWGTHFFWGIGDKGRKFSMAVEDLPEGLTISGIDNRGKRVSHPFEPDTVATLLEQQRLLPSVFTCFSVLAFARGVNCLGGYYQAEYLPDMQAGVIAALEYASWNREWVETIGRVPTDGYLSGMQAVMTMPDATGLIPAGPIEIMAGGGLDGNELNHILSMSIRDAHLASLFDTIPDIAPWEARSDDWKRDMARESFCQLGDTVVTK